MDEIIEIEISECCESSFGEDKYSSLLFPSLFQIPVSSSSIDLSLDYTTPVALVFEPLPLRGTTDQRFETYEYGT